MSDDTISRQAAIDDLHGKDPSQIWDTADIEVWINALPSVQPEPQTCCGYDVNKLIVFATACRQQGVENGDLKAFANNCIFAWNVMSGEIAKTIEDIMRGQSDG